MRTLKSIFTCLAIGTLVPLAFADSLETVGTHARVLYGIFSDSENKKEADQQHKAALQYIRVTPRARLAKDLEAVYRKYGIRKPEGAGAAYLLALHGLEIDKNLTRLSKITMGAGWSDRTMESLPEAYADIALRQKSSLAIKLLVTMKADAFVSEEKSLNVTRVFWTAPDLTVEALASNRSTWPTFLDCLKTGISNDEDHAHNSYYQMAARKAKSAKGNVRALFLRIAAIPKDYE